MLRARILIILPPGGGCLPPPGQKFTLDLETAVLDGHVSFFFGGGELVARAVGGIGAV